MQIHTFAIAAFSSLQWLHPARAFPNFSGTCLAGPNIMPEGTTHFGGNQGTLSDGGFQVQITGLGNMEDGVEIEAGKGYGVTITSDSNFWGYFFRIASDDDIDRSGSIGIPQSSTDALQIMESDGEGITRTDDNDELPAVCASNVAGASHVDVETGRTRLTFILDVAEPGEINVEITMMFSELDFYYTGYTLNVKAAATDPPTDAPVEALTVTPTGAPVSSPTAAPTGITATSGVPVASPPDAPVPDVEPSSAPIPPTISPTKPSASSTMVMLGEFCTILLPMLVVYLV